MTDKQPNNTRSSLKSDKKNSREPQPKSLKREYRFSILNAIKKNRVALFILFLSAILLTFSVFSGLFAGYLSGKQLPQNQIIAGSTSTIDEQYQLGVKDLLDGNVDLAQQRFDFVLSKEPNYPGAADRMAETLYILYATATPTTETPTLSSTSTTINQEPEELFIQAGNALSNQNWALAIDTLVKLRKVDPSFHTARVDGMLFLALRYRGIDKIIKEHNLEGGIYDLALAEKFGPLDVEANRARNWARIYIIGSSFWEAYPQQAVFYFKQVAAGAPYLQDASGWTAKERYRSALIQYGDQLIKQEEWCSAQMQYEAAYAIRADDRLLAKVNFSTKKCSPPTDIPPTATFTWTPTVTGTITVLPTLTSTPNPPLYSPTPTATYTPGAPTSTSPPPTTTPTEPIPTQEPTASPQPSPTPAPTDTPNLPSDPTATP